MPLENTLHGGVLETLDCLLSVLSPSPTRAHAQTAVTATSTSSSAEAGPSRRPHIIADLALPISHCLVAKRGVRMEDISCVRSHEQVSGVAMSILSQVLASTMRLYFTSSSSWLTYWIALSLVGARPIRQIPPDASPQCQTRDIPLDSLRRAFPLDPLGTGKR
jgi:prephenate dehydratase